MKLKIQEAAENGSFKQLNISKKDYGYYSIYKYGIGSNWDLEEVQESRGVILDNGFNVVARGFDKFFNMGESQNSEWSPEGYIAQEKLDGTFIMLWFNREDGSWNVATTGTAHGEGKVGDWDFTFEQLFRSTFREKTGNALERADLDPNLFYYFELCTPYNIVVKEWTTNELFLLGARSATSFIEKGGDELDRISNQIGIKRPSIWKWDSKNPMEILDLLEWDSEGLIFVKEVPNEKGSFHRVKLKREWYVKQHYNKTGAWTKESAIKGVLEGEASELSAYRPQMKSYIEMIDSTLLEWIGQIESVKALFYPCDKKEWSEIITKSGIEDRFKSYFWEWRDNPGLGPREWLKNKGANWIKKQIS